MNMRLKINNNYVYCELFYHVCKIKVYYLVNEDIYKCLLYVYVFYMHHTFIVTSSILIIVTYFSWKDIL
jgi:hypothetical protein